MNGAPGKAKNFGIERGISSVKVGTGTGEGTKGEKGSIEYD